MVLRPCLHQVCRVPNESSVPCATRRWGRGGRRVPPRADHGTPGAARWEAVRENVEAYPTGTLDEAAEFCLWLQREHASIRDMEWEHRLG